MPEGEQQPGPLRRVREFLVSRIPTSASWTLVGWWVALIVGLWGAMLGIGQFLPAYIFLVVAWALCTAKVLHFTLTSTPKRLSACGTGIAILLIGALGVGLWTHRMALKAIEDAQKLAPLSRIPELQKQVDQIPGLKQQVRDLQEKTTEDTEGLNQKQDTITKLASTVLSQQRTIAADQQKQLVSSMATVNQNIQKSAEAVIATQIGPEQELAKRADTLACDILNALNEAGYRTLEVCPAASKFHFHMPIAGGKWSSDPSRESSWAKSCSDHFRYFYLRHVLAIRNELGEVHLRDEELDEELDDETELTAEAQRSHWGPPPLPTPVIEDIAEKIRDLADKAAKGIGNGLRQNYTK